MDRSDLLFVVCVAFFIIRSATGDVIFPIPATYWWEAERGCQEVGGKLYVPPSLQDDVLVNVTDPGETFWLGALAYPSLIWTADNSSLYTYDSYQHVPAGNTSYQVDDNSALNCHRMCHQFNLSESLFGLQANMCYCLTNSTDGDNVYKQENRCPGNVEELCGDENGISVYKILSTEVNPVGECFYAMKDGLVQFIGDNDCFTERSMAASTRYNSTSNCQNDVCVTSGYGNWDEWDGRSNNTLLKVNESNIQDLASVMEGHTGPLTSYWIGLRRFLLSKWINGSDLSGPPIPLCNDSACCLVVYKTSNMSHQLEYAWRTCNDSFRVICEKVEDLSSSSYGTTGTTDLSEETQTTSTLHSTSSTVVSSESSTTEQQIREDLIVNIGFYIGLLVANVAVLGFTILVLVLFRQRRLCFKITRDNDTMGNLPKPEPASDSQNNLHMAQIDAEETLRKDAYKPSRGPEIYVDVDMSINNT